MRALPVLTLALAVAGCGASTASDETTSPADGTTPQNVSALGRLEPQYGVMRISAASTPDAVSGAILAELYVEVGEDIEAGQLLAVTDTASVLEAKVAELETELALAQQEAAAASSSADATCVRAGVLRREADRLSRLLSQKLAAEEQADRASGAAQASAADCTAAQSAARVAESGIEVAKARLRRQLAELERAHVRAPVDARVLAINVRPGEQIMLEGILEIGRVDHMYAIAEVYETDVARLRAGQVATVTSPALPETLTGRIERIRPLVRKQGEIDTDPAARKDARIIEVEVLLDSSANAAGLTNLQVDIVFET